MHGFGHRGGRGGGGGRVFGHGGLRLVLLQLIAEQPAHGYELIKAIEQRLHGQYSPSPGVVYPTLTLLEEQGLIRQEAQEGGRKLCSITEAGREHLAQQRSEVDALMARLARDGSGMGDRPPQVVRALENFKLAMRMRLARPLTPDEANRFAATLDSAAQQIERI